MKSQLKHLVLTLGVICTSLTVSSCGDDDKGTTPQEPGEFTFRSDAPAQYIRVDRMGMPAVATALISPANKPSYNDDDPEDDVSAGGKWAPDIVSNLGALHTALDDDLTGLGLTPATVTLATNQGAPLIIPDVLTLTINQPAGFPNGRKLPDQVIDLTLAVILLDLAAHDVGLFAGLPLNPDSNDKSFSPNFPYLASAH